MRVQCPNDFLRNFPTFTDGRYMWSLYVPGHWLDGPWALIPIGTTRQWLTNQHPSWKCWVPSLPFCRCTASTLLWHPLVHTLFWGKATSRSQSLSVWHVCYFFLWLPCQSELFFRLQSLVLSFSYFWQYSWPQSCTELSTRGWLIKAVDRSHMVQRQISTPEIHVFLAAATSPKNSLHIRYCTGLSYDQREICWCWQSHESRYTSRLYMRRFTYM